MHLFAFTASLVTGSTNADMPGVADQAQTINSAAHYILQNEWFVKAAWAGGVNLTNARIDAPSLRQVATPSVQPVDAAAVPADLPAFADYGDFELTLAALDELSMQATHSDAGTQRVRGAILAAKRKMPAQHGPMYTLRATATVVSAAETWAAGAIAFDQTLVPGRYQVVGGDMVGANAVFWRLAFPAGGPRPGWLAKVTVAVDVWRFARAGKLGPWGEFEHTAPPLLEVFGSAATATQTLFLDVVKIR
jgi:hypothetical protein